MTTPALRLRSHAKINWVLEVLRRRDDGYHELRTVLQTISLCDELTFWPSQQPAFDLRLAQPWDIPAGPDNLALRARARYQHAFPARDTAIGPLAMLLDKRIPAAAGLGGGSSNAACVLRGMDQLSAAPLGATQLETEAAQIDSDTPFFVRGGTQLASGRGERLTELPDVPATWLVLVTPPTTVMRKTAVLFDSLSTSDFSGDQHTITLVERIRHGNRPDPKLLYNTFDRAADAAFAGLTHCRHELVWQCGHAVLSGAGPALFAIVASRDEADRAVAALYRRGITAQSVSTVSAQESTTPASAETEAP
jgi:4-diphosphocytidyl-2-C-methyl-D-erythritol kinase